MIFVLKANKFEPNLLLFRKDIFLVVFSTIVLIIPSATLLKANGSFELVGFSLIPKNPTKVSILSVKHNATL